MSVPFAEYLAWPQLNASLLVHAFKSWRQFRHVQQFGYRPRTDTRVGTALHSMVELLPVERFQDVFVTMPDFKSSPDNVTGAGKPSSSRTAWVKEQEEAFIEEHQGREVLSVSEYKRCLRMLSAIQRNIEAMNLVEASRKEVSLKAELNGVDCKGRIDGLTASCWWDLKSTRDVAPSHFGRTAANLHYVFKMAFYWRLLADHGVERNAAYLIAVQDSIPHKDGSWNDAADCAVFEIPMVALENQMAKLDRLLDEFKRCERTGIWPGVPNGDLVIPNWAMSESGDSVQWELLYDE